jgi:transglutaminase-like putative cysteine protease
MTGAIPQVTYKDLSDGTAGTLQSLAAMRQAVLNGLPPEYIGYQDPSIRRHALAIGSATQEQPYVALYRFVRDRIGYVDHPWSMQVVQDATRTLQYQTGDCVSKSVLLAALLASIGYTSRFVVAAETPEGFNHVYVEMEQPDGSCLALDPTADGRDGRPRGDIGWSPTLEDGGFLMSYDIF